MPCSAASAATVPPAIDHREQGGPARRRRLGPHRRPRASTLPGSRRPPRWRPVAGLQGAGDPTPGPVVLLLLADAEAPQLRPRVAATAAVPNATASAPMVSPPMRGDLVGEHGRGRPRPPAASRRVGRSSVGVDEPRAPRPRLQREVAAADAVLEEVLDEGGGHGTGTLVPSGSAGRPAAAQRGGRPGPRDRGRRPRPRARRASRDRTASRRCRAPRARAARRGASCRAWPGR